MNKIQVLFVFMAFVVASFAIGYKIGDSRGYTDGYNEGYRYDCRDEISNLYDQVKTQRKVTEFAQESIRNVLRENDSLKDPATARRRYEDSVAFREQFTKDSLLHWKEAKRKNDSLEKLIGFNTNVYSPTGKFNPGACVLPQVFDAVPECEQYKGLRKLLTGGGK